MKSLNIFIAGIILANLSLSYSAMAEAPGAQNMREEFTIDCIREGHREEPAFSQCVKQKIEEFRKGIKRDYSPK